MKFVLTNTELDILKAISYIIDVEEGEKLFHSWRVAVIAKYLAEEKCRDSTLPIYIAGLLHDVGTFDISNRLTHYLDYLENIEDADVRVHPQKGAAIVASLSTFIPIAKIILDHHEWLSGEGYPRGLKQKDISLESQILRIADRTAFLIDTKTVTEITALPKALEGRVGREFSKDLYDGMLSQLEKNNMWESVRDEKLLTELNKRIFVQLPVEKKDRGVVVNKELLHFFGRLLDAKHSYTEGHSRRVSYFSILIALALNLAEEEIEKIESAGFLHDIGKVGIPISILDKKEPLRPDEFKIIKKHASLSYEIVKGIWAFEKLADIVGADQEHWDGSGYPKGLKREGIPIGARVIFIADAFEAMTSNRIYHQAISVAEAINELKRCAGIDFDPQLVKVASKIFEGFKNSAILACYIK